MRYAIISDIHSNEEALTAVFHQIDRENVDRTVCLGDIVGYGANPRECMKMIRDRGIFSIAGNHDFAVIGRTNINYFNAYAKEATLWTRKVTTEEEKEYLRSLPLVEYIDDFTLVHGTLYSPELFDYIQTTYDAYLSLQLLENQVCFLGHSHVPITFFHGEMITYTLAPEIKLEPGVKALVNVGSVGQPRDDNPKASFGIYDLDEKKVYIRRVEYDVDGAMNKIRKAGLPEALAERLKFGR